MPVESITPSSTTGQATSIPATVPNGTEFGLSRLGDPTGAPLIEQAREAATVLATGLGRAGDPVATARLETAALGFAREVRALHVGNPDVAPAVRSDAIGAAFTVGEEHAAALSPVGFDAIDRVVTMLDGAARALSDLPAPPLVGSAAITQGA